MNLRYAALLENYRQYDRLTLVLAGIALLFVLMGLFLNARVRSRLDRFLVNCYYVITLVLFILTLAGATYVLRNGGHL